MKKLQEEPICISSEEDLILKMKEFVRHQKVKFICCDCEKELTAQLRHIEQYPIRCGKCKIKKTNLEHFGVTCNLLEENTRRKIIEAAHTKEANEKRRNSIDYEKAYKKREETFYKKYGVKTNFQLEENKQKIRATCKEKYGTSWTTTKESLEKNRNTCKEKYGKEFYFQTQEFRERSKTKMLEKYGVENSMQSPEVRSKARSRYFYDDAYFDSSWELAYYIWLKHNKKDFEYHPKRYFEYGQNSRYFPDFLVEGKYVEIKGNQYFDENGEFFDFYGKHKNDEQFKEKLKCMKDNNIIILKKEDCELFISFAKDLFKDFPKCFKFSKSV